MGKKKCYTNNVHGEDCENQAEIAESQTQGRAEFARTNTLVDRATAGPQPARVEVAVLEEARTKCSERSHVNDCLSCTELFCYSVQKLSENALSLFGLLQRPPKVVACFLRFDERHVERHVF